MTTIAKLVPLVAKLNNVDYTSFAHFDGFVWVDAQKSKCVIMLTVFLL